MVHCDELSAQGHQQTCWPVSVLCSGVPLAPCGEAGGWEKLRTGPGGILFLPPFCGLQWAQVGPKGQPALLEKPSSTGSRNWGQRVSTLFDKLEQPPLLQMQGEPWHADSSLLPFPFPLSSLFSSPLSFPGGALSQCPLHPFSFLHTCLLEFLLFPPHYFPSSESPLWFLCPCSLLLLPFPGPCSAPY